MRPDLLNPTLSPQGVASRIRNLERSILDLERAPMPAEEEPPTEAVVQRIILLAVQSGANVFQQLRRIHQGINHSDLWFEVDGEDAATSDIALSRNLLYLGDGVVLRLSPTSLWTSFDYGESWESHTLPSGSPIDMAAAPIADKRDPLPRVFVVMSGDIYYSDDFGETWTLALDTAGVDGNERVHRVSVSPTNPSLVLGHWANNIRVGIYISDDGGTTFMRWLGPGLNISGETAGCFAAPEAECIPILRCRQSGVGNTFIVDRAAEWCSSVEDPPEAGFSTVYNSGASAEVAEIQQLGDGLSEMFVAWGFGNPSNVWAISFDNGLTWENLPRPDPWTTSGVFYDAAGFAYDREEDMLYVAGGGSQNGGQVWRMARVSRGVGTWKRIRDTLGGVDNMGIVGLY